MRKTGNILIVPGAVTPEKKVSALNTISFLVSSSEIEPVTNSSEHQGKDEGDHAHGPGPLGYKYTMGEYEGDADARKNLTFLNTKDNDPRDMGNEKVTFITVSYSSAGEKTFAASSPAGKSCRDIPQKKNESVDYPGRSVLYSRQFSPLNRITSTDYQKPSGEP
jgi:hypothetical protein